MTELKVDKKHRITLPKELREALGIASGSVVEAEYKDRAIVITPKVPLKKPTQALWGMVPGVVEESPKQAARQAIAKGSRLGR
ncbi:MAG: AbrB/MazE/SpoVT family DNA-binding domain-containing protein [Candidatus Bathyarchaeia archaeon]